MPTSKARAHPNNLHVPLSTFIGHEREIAEVKTATLVSTAWSDLCGLSTRLRGRQFLAGSLP